MNQECSSGPVSTLPGTVHSLPLDPGTKCIGNNMQCEADATVVVQGETDSFGCEYLHFCQACYDQHKVAMAAHREQPARCDWCHQMKTGLRERRDCDEGSSGPVYDVCPDCIKADNARLQAELDDYYD